jgi:tRNA (pseudouridine54-N1)-methyltransferase
MRRFVVVSLTAPTNGDFSLEDLPGSAGRIDILCRCAGAALLVSHGIRKDSEIHLIILTDRANPRTISIHGDRVRSLNPDERTTASLLRIALSSRNEMETSPGVVIRNMGLPGLLDELKATRLYLLDETGEDARNALASIRRDDDATFVLGARDDVPQDLRELCITRGAKPISISPLSLQSEQCITIVHNSLDRLEI